MIRTIAIPIFGNRVSSRLDCSESFLLFAIEDGKIVQRQEIRWTNANVLQKIHLLLQEGVSILICGGLTETCERLLRENSIEVIPWIRGEIEEVVSRFLEGTLYTIVPGEHNARFS